MRSALPRDGPAVVFELFDYVSNLPTSPMNIVSRPLRLHPAACIAAIICFAAACGSSNQTAPSPAPTVVRRVVVLGDSLSVTPSLAESFPAVLQSQITQAGLPWTMTNAGISG